MGIERVVEDWSATMQRWEAWWDGEIHDRVLFCVTAPRALPPPNVPQVDVVTQWTDAGFMVQRALEQVRTTYFGGDAIPVFWHNWSAGHALYFGCEPHYARDTVWVDPAPVKEDGYPTFEGWQDSPWWGWMQDMIGTAARASQGRYLVMPMCGNHAGDNLALVRGPQTLMMDIGLNPAWVKQAVKAVSDVQIQVFRRLWELVSPDIVGVEGSTNYVACWSPRRTLAFDCDVSCMVSPQTFRRIFLSPLVETMQTVDHRIYHLDGPVALQHLDTLLDLTELHAIQWVPGAGRNRIMQWVPLIRRIQEKGKSIVVNTTPDEVEPLLKEVRPEGLCIQTSCKTEAEARALLAHVGKLSGQPQSA